MLTCWPYIKKNPPEAAKDATSVKFFNVGKNKAYFPHQDFEIQFFSTLKNFTEVATLAASGGFFKILSLHVVHTKIFV